MWFFFDIENETKLGSPAMRGKRQKRKLIWNFNLNCTEFGVENFIHT